MRYLPATLSIAATFEPAIGLLRLAGVPTRLAPYRLAEAALGEEFLLTRGERELTAALAAYQFFVLGHLLTPQRVVMTYRLAGLRAVSEWGMASVPCRMSLASNSVSVCPSEGINRPSPLSTSRSQVVLYHSWRLFAKQVFAGLAIRRLWRALSAPRRRPQPECRSPIGNGYPAH